MDIPGLKKDVQTVTPEGKPVTPLIEGVRIQPAVTLADDVSALIDWLRQDILAVPGPDYASRCALYDWIVAELQELTGRLIRHRLGYYLLYCSA